MIEFTIFTGKTISYKASYEQFQALKGYWEKQLSLKDLRYIKNIV